MLGLGIFKELLEKRLLLIQVTLHDIKAQYAGTLLGIGWILIGPIILLALYSIVYAFIFQVRLPDFTVVEYILYVFAGLVPFLAFSQSLAASAGCLQSEKKLLFNTLFPTEFIPIKSVLSSCTILVVGVLITVLGDILFSQSSLLSIFLPLLVIFQLIFSIGIGMFISLLAIVFKDIQFLIQYIVLALLIVTPITYTPDMVPERALFLLYLNPLFYLVSAYQSLIILNEMPSAIVLISIFTMSLSVFWLGAFLFEKTEKVLKDLV